MKSLLLLCLLGLAPLVALAVDPIYYVDWQTGSAASGTAAGVITVPKAGGGSSTVTVSFTSRSIANPAVVVPIFGYQAGCGTNFWYPSAPYISADYPNGPPACDIVQLAGEIGTRYTITLSEAIKDPLLAILSLGNSGDSATYAFDTPFTIIKPTSSQPGYWNGGYPQLVQQDSKTLVGFEGHGLIRFDGTYSTFSWTVPDNEYWHGITFAIRTTQALDCQISAFTPVGTCSAPCGTSGLQLETATITQQPTGSGVTCPPLSRYVACNRFVCPVNCQISAFTSVGTCSATCGDSGLQRQTATITVQPAGTGAACPSLEQFVPCNRFVCPVDCQISAFTPVGECSSTCGDAGLQRLTASITVQPAGTGATCPSLEQFVPCNRFVCPVDCQISAFTPAGECSSTCGDAGLQRETATITVQPAGTGATCPALEQFVPCNRFVCPVDCEISAFGPVGECSAACGDAGLQRETATITVQPAGTGLTCPSLEQFVPCNRFVCPVDCEISAFAPAGECSAACGDAGLQRETATVTVEPAGTGATCPSLEQFVPCNRFVCPVDCEISAFGPVGECSAACGDAGLQRETATITVEQAGTGATCPSLEQFVPCNRFVCPVDCQISAFTPVGECSSTCGDFGLQRETATVTVETAGTGATCPALEQFVPCNRDIPCNCPATVPQSGTSYIQGAQTGVTPGSTTSFTVPCAAGFTSSITTATCALGTWSTPAAPTCSANQCAEVLTIANGQVTPSGVGYTGTSASFSCDAGYVLSGGVALQTCGADGLWTSALGAARPTCVRSTCKEVAVPTGGYLTTQAQPNAIVITYNCLSGFNLNAKHQTYKCHIPSGKLTPADQKTHPMPTCTP